MTDKLNHKFDSSKAVQRAKGILSGLDEDDIECINLEVTYKKDEDDSSTGRRTRTTNDDRKLKGVEKNSNYHFVLSVLKHFKNEGEDKITSKTFEKHTSMDSNRAASALSVVFKRKLADRNEGKKLYPYWITEYGEVELKELGPYSGKEHLKNE